MPKEVKIATSSYVLNHDSKMILSVTTRISEYKLGPGPHETDLSVVKINLISADEHHVWFRLSRENEDGDEAEPQFVLHRGEYEIRSMNLDEN